MNKELKELYNSAGPEQKLTILRMEMKMPISTIRGYIALMKKNYESNNYQPEVFKDWITQIGEAAEHLQELFDELR